MNVEWIRDPRISLSLTMEEAVQLRALCSVPRSLGDAASLLAGSAETGEQVAGFLRVLGRAFDDTGIPLRSLNIAFGGER